VRRIRLQHLAQVPIQNGLGLPGEHDNPDWPRYVRTTDIASPTTLRGDVFASQPPDVAKGAPLLPGDIVATAAGATIGKSLLYREATVACYAGFLVRIRLKASTDARFIAYWMQSKDYWAQIDKGAVRSTIDNFSASKYRALLVPDWPRDEQRRIADFLDDRVARIDQIITARRAQVEAVEGRFVADRRSAVLGAGQTTQPSPLRWARKIGSEWSVRRLSQLARMGTGHTPSRSEPDYWVNCDIPWLTTSDVHRFRSDQIDEINETEIEISELGLANSAAVLHPARTVALSRTASAGFSIIMGRDMATSQDFATWTCGEDLLPEFLLQSLRVMRPFLLGYLSMGSTHKTIYFPDLMDIRIPVPSLGRQADAVASVAEAARDRSQWSEALSNQMSLLSEYKQSLITAAVTGELDVTTAGNRIPG